MFSSLTGLLGVNRKDVVGVDIGTSAVKIIHLETRGDKHILKNFAIARLKEGVIQSSNQIIAGKQISRIFRLALKQGQIKPKTVSFSIPSFSSFISFITLSKVPKDELESKIEIEARKYIPVPISEVSLGWEVINENEKIKSMDSKEEKMKVLLMAVSKNVIKKYETIAKKSKVNLGSIEVECFSLIRALVGKDKGASLILDVGSRICNIIVVANGFLKGNRNVDVGGGDITEAISRGMKVDFIRAEMLKKEKGLADPQLSNLISPVAGRIYHETKRMMDIYNEKNPNKKIGRVIISGGTTKLKGFKDYLQQGVGVEVEEGNPWKDVKFDKKHKKVLFKFKDELAVAIGMAISE